MTGTDWSALTSAITSSLSSGEILSMIGVLIGASIGMVLVWTGARKITGAVISAFKGGRIKF